MIPKEQLETNDQISRRLVAESGLNLYGKRRQAVEDLIFSALQNRDRRITRTKPLQWAWLVVNGVGVWHAEAPIGGLDWRLYQIGDEWHLNPSGKSSVQCASSEDGKQVAEAQWREYVRRALDLMTTQDANRA